MCWFPGENRINQAVASLLLFFPCCRSLISSSNQNIPVGKKMVTINLDLIMECFHWGLKTNYSFAIASLSHLHFNPRRIFLCYIWKMTAEKGKKQHGWSTQRCIKNLAINFYGRGLVIPSPKWLKMRRNSVVFSKHCCMQSLKAFEIVHTKTGKQTAGAGGCVEGVITH